MRFYSKIMKLMLAHEMLQLQELHVLSPRHACRGGQALSLSRARSPLERPRAHDQLRFFYLHDLSLRNSSCFFCRTGWR